MSGLMLSDNLKLTNIVKMTDERIKKLNMADLKEILSSIEETEANLIVNAIKKGRFDMVGSIIEFVTYKTMQKKVKK